MPTALQPFVAYFRAGFRRWSTYRSATFAGAFTNSIFGLAKASLTVAAITSAGGHIAGYDDLAGATYAWWTQALLGPVNVFQWTELSDRVRTGDIAIDLARPVDLQLSWLAADLGRAAFTLLPRGVPPLLLGALTFGLTGPSTVWPYLLGIVSVVLAVALSFAGRFIMNLSAFWLVEIRGVVTLYMVALGVLCGLIIPVPWFPGWLLVLARCTPFPSMLQTPVDVLSGHAQGSHALLAVGVQIAWLAGVMLLGRVVLRRATRKLVVQGG